MPVDSACRRCRILAVSAILVAAVLPPDAVRAADETPPETDHVLIGNWLGTLKTGTVDLRLLVKIERSEDGTLTATLDSLDQGANDLPIDSLSLDGSAFRMEMKALNGEFAGTLNSANGEIDGQWNQSGATLPLRLKKVDAPPKAGRPQDPEPPYPYREREITYENPQADVRFAGTLTLPPGDGPFPAVLLITGSGPQDRNESLMGHRPFLVLADSLTRRGIAVLRVDDRGVGGSTGDVATSTSDDFAGDALAGVEFLKQQTEVDASLIGLVGHSEGGLVAPLAASRSSDVAFIVLIAGPGLTGEEILYRQGELITAAAGAPPAAIAQQRQVQQRLFEFVKQDLEPADLEKKLLAVFGELQTGLSDEEKQAARAQVDAQIQTVQTPWFRFFLTYDPVPTLKKVGCPVLAIFGEKDLQVPAEVNAAAVEQALGDGGNRDYAVHVLPGLNHLLQTCETGSPSEYGKIEETIAPAALDLIGDWIVEHTTNRPE